MAGLKRVSGVTSPHFLIDLWGEESQIALLVADDLNQLLATLKAVEPLSEYSIIVS